MSEFEEKLKTLYIVSKEVLHVGLIVYTDWTKFGNNRCIDCKRKKHCGPVEIINLIWKDSQNRETINHPLIQYRHLDMSDCVRVSDTNSCSYLWICDYIKDLSKEDMEEECRKFLEM
jgi:hypothetical protein